jgi:hypothetical protein
MHDTAAKSGAPIEVSRGASQYRAGEHLSIVPGATIQVRGADAAKPTLVALRLSGTGERTRIIRRRLLAALASIAARNDVSNVPLDLIVRRGRLTRDVRRVRALQWAQVDLDSGATTRQRVGDAKGQVAVLLHPRWVGERRLKTVGLAGIEKAVPVAILRAHMENVSGAHTIDVPGTGGVGYSHYRCVAFDCERRRARAEELVLNAQRLVEYPVSAATAIESRRGLARSVL